MKNTLIFGKIYPMKIWLCQKFVLTLHSQTQKKSYL
jgi:hypothetical protein